MNVAEMIIQAEKAVREAEDLQQLEAIRTQYLGKKGQVTDLLKMVGQLSEAERPKIGNEVNRAKDHIQALFHQRINALKRAQLDAKLLTESIDVTLPGSGYSVGSLHPLKQVMNRTVDILSSMGFVMEKGPEIEDSYHNFEALNIPMHHPVRSPIDTFYFEDGTALRPQTSTVQIRCMATTQPPLRIIAPGKVYRRDFDATHSPMFHQIEGLLIDEHVTFSDLKGVVIELMSQFFEDSSTKVRFRPSYFPFTEPSAEVDIQLHGKNKWLEVGGCGMVHPNVLKHGNIDTEKYTGYAFGFGLDRLTMLYYKIDDIRLLFENDLRFLKQF